MAVGTQATQAGINAALTSLAGQLRNVTGQISNFAEFVNALGLTGLEALGYSAADAGLVLSAAGYMSTVAGVYQGSVQQGGTGGTGASAFNFDSALCLLRAGQ